MSPRLSSTSRRSSRGTLRGSKAITMRRATAIGTIKIYFELAKVKIALFSSLTALAGSVLATGEMALTAVAAAVCLFVLAAGSCALNEYQERDTDALFERTRGRPIPSNRVLPGAALLFAILLLMSGFVLLALAAGWLPAFLGGFAALWYNGVYTPLKKRLPFAAVVGAVSGALPPCAGWAAAGGSLLEPRFAAVALFFFLWQVPHFWLLLLSRGEAPVSFARAHVASPICTLDRSRLSRVISVWMCATAVSGTIMPLFGMVRSLWALAILSAGAAALFSVAVGFPLVEERGLSARRALRSLHAYTLLTVLTAAADSFILRGGFFK
jgi:heme o synthase